jgi:hypothetical protein
LLLIGLELFLHSKLSSTLLSILKVLIWETRKFWSLEGSCEGK